MSLATGLNRGKVTRANASGVWVQIPSLYGTAELGPFDALGTKIRRPAQSTSSAGSHTHSISTDGTSPHNHGGATGSAGSHTHDLPQADYPADRYEAGDRVLVATIGPGDYIILGRIATGVNT